MGVGGGRDTKSPAGAPLRETCYSLPVFAANRWARGVAGTISAAAPEAAAHGADTSKAVAAKADTAAPRIAPGVRHHAPGLLLGLVLGVLALGPGLQRGFLLSYDMLFVPREPFSAALAGLKTGVARPVPSDFVVAVLSRALPADIVQKLVLLAIFVLACGGVAALLDREPMLARLAAGVFYTWNPYVAERLIIGQWALLLGYAGLPWVLRAVTRERITMSRLILAMLPAIASGFASMAITALVAVPVVALRRSPRDVAVTAGILIAGCLPWLVPSLLHPVYADPQAIAEFAARPDTPFGSIGSLIMLGGMWNAQTVPAAYGGAWSALWLAVVLAAAGAYVVLARPSGRWRGLGIAAAAGLVIASLGVTTAGRELLRAASDLSAGFAMFRDGQQYVAPLALAEAIGAGAGLSWAMRARPFGAHREPRLDAAGKLYGVLAVLVPVVLLPGLAWGAAGRLRPASYPASWLAAVRLIDGSQERGAVLVLPWASYRLPAWNHGEVVIDPWSRLLSRQVIWNDGTQVGSVVMAPDDPPARRLDPVIGGGGPLTGALRAAGVRFVIVDAGPSQTGRLPGCAAVLSDPDVIVYRVPW
jgi:hypothetical protein